MVDADARTAEVDADARTAERRMIMEEIKDYPPYLDYPKPYKPITNADRIRAMSDEELAAFLCKKFGCHSDTCPGIELCNPNEGKANGLLKWLQQPAEPPKEE